MTPALPPTPPERSCGDCVVYNDCGDGLIGGCSRFGYVAAGQAACRAWFPKHELGRALYGKGAT